MNKINIHDFCFMNQGKIICDLTAKKQSLLKPIKLHNPTNNSHALLLIHGFASSPAVFRKLIPHITQYATIYALSLPGHCTNLCDFAACHSQEWIKAVEIAYLELNQHHHKIDILGLSLGGFLAYQLSLVFELNHLYLLAPALIYPRYIRYSLPIIRILNKFGIKYFPSKAGSACAQNALELTYRRLPLHAIIEILTLTLQKNFTVPTCKTDLFLGQHDPIVSSTQIAALWKNAPNITTHWLKNSA